MEKPKKLLKILTYRELCILSGIKSANFVELKRLYNKCIKYNKHDLAVIVIFKICYFLNIKRFDSKLKNTYKIMFLICPLE